MQKVQNEIYNIKMSGSKRMRLKLNTRNPIVSPEVPLILFSNVANRNWQALLGRRNLNHELVMHGPVVFVMHMKSRSAKSSEGIEENLVLNSDIRTVVEGLSKIFIDVPDLGLG